MPTAICIACGKHKKENAQPESVKKKTPGGPDMACQAFFMASVSR